MARPLAKVSRKGVVYTRPPSVEASIDEALRLDLPTLKRRLQETDKKSPNYLASITANSRRISS